MASISGGTGASFSLLPPDNASGNFVKVVQRVPVRISWDGPTSDRIPAGSSAEVVVYTKCAGTPNSCETLLRWQKTGDVHPGSKLPQGSPQA